MKVVLVSVSALAFIAAVFSTPAEACTPFSNELYTPDPEHASDHEPPSEVLAAASTFDGPDDSYMCGWNSALELQVAATDDATPIHRLGYQLRVVEGKVEMSGLGLRDEPVSVGILGRLAFYFDDEELDFTLEIRAVDLNGNIGPPTLVQVKHEVEHEGGCSSATHHSLVTMLALILVVRRRRRHGMAT